MPVIYLKKTKKSHRLLYVESYLQVFSKKINSRQSKSPNILKETVK